MDLAGQLFGLLSAGAALAVSGAVGEFAKSGGKAAFEALTARLASAHQVDSLPLLEKAKTSPAFAGAIRSELEAPAIAADAELRQLAETLRAAIEALPEAAARAYAVDIETIRAGGDLLFRDVEGVAATTAESKGDMTFEGIKSPPGKS